MGTSWIGSLRIDFGVRLIKPNRLTQLFALQSISGEIHGFDQFIELIYFFIGYYKFGNKKLQKPKQIFPFNQLEGQYGYHLGINLYKLLGFNLEISFLLFFQT